MRVLRGLDAVNQSDVGGVECGYKDEEEDDEACSNKQLGATTPAIGLRGSKDSAEKLDYALEALEEELGVVRSNSSSREHLNEVHVRYNYDGWNSSPHLRVVVTDWPVA